MGTYGSELWGRSLKEINQILDRWILQDNRSETLEMVWKYSKNDRKSMTTGTTRINSVQQKKVKKTKMELEKRFCTGN